MNGSDTYLDVNNSHLRVTSGNVYASSFNLDQISIVTTSNTGSTINFLNDTKGFTSSSNIEVGTANLFVNTTTSRVGIGTNAPAHTLDVHGTANIGTITTTDINVTGNLTVLGTTTTLDTVNLRVKDPIIEIGKDNTASPVVDLGLILTRPATTSNVAIIFDETTDTLEIGYTQSNASDTDITMRAAATEPLSVNVNGTISGNGSGLTALNATNVTTGTLTAARIPVLDAAKITTGTLTAARIPDLDAAKIATGTLTVARGGTGATGSSTGTGGVVLSVAPAFTGDVTFDTDTLKIDSTNNRVGIGSTLPRTNLHIGQQLNSQGDKDTIPSAGLGTSADFPSSTHAWFANRVNATGDEYWGLAVGTIYDGSSYLQNLNKDTSTYYDILLQPNGGNVGIGTTSPGKALDVQFTGDSGIRSKNSGSSHASVYIDSGSGYSYLRFESGGAAKFWLQSSPNGDLAFRPSGGGHVMDILNNGNVGIGTTSPRTGLHLSRDAVGTLANKYSSPGLTFTALNNSTTDMRGGSIWSQWGDPQYGLAFRGVSSGDTFPYLATPAMFVTSDKVGIGTTSPHAPLTVFGIGGSLTGGSYRTYFSAGNLPSNSGSGWSAAGGNDLGIFSDKTISTKSSFISMDGTFGASDKRIKKDIIDIDDGSALDTLRLLKPKQYKYKDDIKKGSEPVWGFIAQEVSNTLPHSIQLRTECLPNIYELASVSDSNVITFTNFDTSTLESNAFVLKLYDTKDEEHLITMNEVIDEHTIRVSEDLGEWIGSLDETGNVVAGNQIFVYGQQVDDFTFLKKDAIWTVATSALQEVDRQLQDTKAQLASVLTRLDALENA